MRKTSWFIAVALVLLLAASVLAETQRDSGWFDKPTYRPMIIDNSTVIDANNIEMIVTNHGSFAYDLEHQDAGLWFPRGTDKTCVYASGLWVGCKVGQQVLITAGSFTQEYTPGPILAGCTWPDVGAEEHKVYKIYNGMDTTEFDYQNWPSEYGAPVDGEGKPLLIGDQTLWAVYNDADPSVHISDEGSASQTGPMGIEVQQTTFAFDWSGALGNVVFTKFLVINKCSQTLDSTFFSVWCDPDVGGASDDYVGCDTTLSVGYAYNATNNDNLYASTPPCPGYDFFKGPIGDDGKELPMTSFNMYINATDPREADESWNYMRGLDLAGNPVVDPTTSQVTTYMFPGDPVENTGWLDSDPADRRFMLNTGPFTMEPGDTQEVVVGLIVGQGNDRIGAVRVMKFYDLTAQVAFDLDFDLPQPPDRPVVSVAELDREVRLGWGTVSEVDKGEGYTFEGYNVYQSASVSTAGPWKIIATYDLPNGIGTIEDLTLNIEFGVPIVQPVQFGKDAGVQRHIEVVEDRVKGVPLNNGTTYYYKVGAYSYNPTPDEGLPKTLESYSPIIAAIPQEAGADVVIMEEFDACEVVHGLVTPGEIPSTDRVQVLISNPFELTGDTYRIDFQHEVPPIEIVEGTDTILVHYTWNLKNETQGGAYFYSEWRTNKTGREPFLVTDGFVAKVLGLHTAGGVQAVQYVQPDGCHESDALTGVDAGLGFPINGAGGQGAGYGADFFGSTLDPVANEDQFVTVEIRFSHSDTQMAYKYDRPGYGYMGFVEVPFTVWDVENDVQLNACFVEWVDSDVYDDTWTPDATDVGGREYLFVMRSDYDAGGGMYDDDTWGPGEDVLYAFWVRLSSSSAMIEDGSILRVVWALPSSDNDYFTFTPASESFSAEKAKGQLDKIRVVPNPYFAKSTYEINQFDHVLKFSNLPRECTIRIFNLAGDLVRTIEKTDPTISIAEWNLLNEKEIPVASGFYIFHVEAPGIGSKYGKFAVFLEKERLNTF